MSIKYIVYETINMINGKIYVGVHKTDNINDTYLGSGMILKTAIKKYGENNFKRIIIDSFNNKDDAYNLERELVDLEFIKNKNTYNIRLGGDGGDGGEETNQKISEALKEKLPNQMFTYEAKKKRIQTIRSRYGGVKSFYNKKHTSETKEKMKQNMKGKQSGSKNSQFGSCWIYCPILRINKKIKNSNLNHWIELGWIKGRKMF